MHANMLMLAAFVISTVLAVLCILILRALRRRQERRSPLYRRVVGRVPGQQLVDRVTDLQEKMLLSVIIMYFSFPTMLLAWALVRVPPERMRLDGSAGIFIAGAICMFAYGLWDFRRHLVARQAARDGLLAERVTGMQLNRLVAHGCIVLHDVPSDTGNIDHIVVASRGVYVVETKSFRKPPPSGNKQNEAAYQVRFDGSTLMFPDFMTRKPVEQVLRHADWLRRYLREVLKADVPVIGAVALPGWFIVQDEVVWRSSAIKVFSPLGEGANFMMKEVVAIDPTTRNLIASAVAQRFQVVVD